MKQQIIQVELVIQDDGKYVNFALMKEGESVIIKPAMVSGYARLARWGIEYGREEE